MFPRSKIWRMAVAVLLLAMAGPAQAAVSPLWAALAPGRYAIGFKYIYAFDRTRTWKKTRGYQKRFEPDVEGRPIRINVWYPATAASGRRMAFGDYVEGSAPEAFKDYDALVRAHDLFHSRLNVPKGALPKFLATPVEARLDAKPLAQRFPLVIYCDGLDGDTVSNVVLAEYLASHGFIVATIPIMGPDLGAPVQKRVPADLETTIRDMEFAWSSLRSSAEVDPAKLAVMGHSLGAVEAVLFAMRNNDVSAVVGLDGTYGFKGATDVLTGFQGYDPMRLQAALLDLRRAEKTTGPSAFAMDLSAVQSFHYAPLTLVTLTGMYHTDFTDYGILAKLFGMPPFADRDYETGSAGYQAVCRIVADFLDQSLKQAPSRLKADVASAPGGTMRAIAGIAVPPTPDEMVSLASAKGLPAAEAIIQRYKREAPGDVIVNEADYDALGYALLEKHRNAKAIVALQIDTYAYPGSANLADSLGDMYAGAGDAANARKAYLHGIALLPNDREQNEEGRNELKLTLEQALGKLPAK